MVWKRFDFDDVPIERGETLTVWMKTIPDWIQIELRVERDGTPYLYCDKLSAKPFDEGDHTQERDE